MMAKYLAPFITSIAALFCTFSDAQPHQPANPDARAGAILVDPEAGPAFARSPAKVDRVLDPEISEKIGTDAWPPHPTSKHQKVTLPIIIGQPGAEAARKPKTSQAPTLVVTETTTVVETVRDTIEEVATELPAATEASVSEASSADETPTSSVAKATASPSRNATYGQVFQIGGQPAPKTDEEKGMMEVVAFYINLMHALVREGCEGFYPNHFVEMNLPGRYKRDTLCKLAKQMAEITREVDLALQAGGIEPLPECRSYEFPYEDDNPIGFLRVVWWYAGIGRALLLGSLQVIDNNPPLMALIADLLTHIVRVHVLVLVDPRDTRDQIDPIPATFDVAVHPFLAYHLLTHNTDGCVYPGVPQVPELITSMGIQFPLKSYPAKNTPPSVAWQFSWNLDQIKQDLDDGRPLWIAWLGGANNVTLTEVRRCGEDHDTGWSCGRTDLPKGFTGTIGALLVDSNTADYERGVDELLTHTVAGPAHLILS